MWQNLPTEKFGVIVIDPPWPYEQELTSPKARGGALKHYSCLSIAEISTLPVKTLALPDCMIWLWTTNAHIHHAFHILKAWGIRYSGTKLVWVKTQIGLGYWLRGQTEDALLGIIGNPRSKLTGPHGTTGKAYSTVILHAKRTQHSAKPDAFYDMAQDVAKGPYLDMFARTYRLGWTSWGDFA